MGLKAQSWWRSTERLGTCLDLALIGRCHDHDDDGDVDVDDAEDIVEKSWWKSTERPGIC